MDDPIKETGQIQEHYKTETLQKHSELNVGTYLMRDLNAFDKAVYILVHTAHKS